MAITDENTEHFDETDIALLESIDEDFDVSLDELSEELGLSNSAIHYRLNNLKDAGVIESVTADINPVSLGLTMVAQTKISVTHQQGYSEDIGTEIAEIPGVEQVYYTMGDVDFIAISRVQDREQLNEVLEKLVGIDGVNETSSTFILGEVKKGNTVIPNMSAQMRDNLIGDDP